MRSRIPAINFIINRSETSPGEHTARFIEAVIFASAEPVGRETLARVVGRDCSIDLLVDDLKEELRDRPYELLFIAGGWQHRTRTRFAGTIRAGFATTRSAAAALSEFEAIMNARCRATIH